MVPYHQPVAPVTPFVQVNAPELIMEGGRQGLQAFLQASQQRQRYQLESQQLIQQAALSEQKNQLEREKMGLDFALGTQQLEMQREWHKDATSAAITNANANLERAKTGLSWTAESRRLQSEAIKDFTTEMAKYKMNDPQINPIEYGAGVSKLEEGFGSVRVPEIQAELKRMRDSVKENYAQLKVGEEKRKIPYADIVEGLKGPNADWWKNVLQQNGLYTPGETKNPGIWERLVHSITGSRSGKPSKLEPRQKPEQFKGEQGDLTSFVEMGKGVDFSKKNIKKHGPGSYRPDMPNPDTEEPLLPETEVETRINTEVARAKRVIEIGVTEKGMDRAAITSQVRAMLESKGIDPSELDK